MNSPRLAALAAKLLARAPLPTPTLAASDRDRAIARIELALLRKARLRRLRWAGGLAAAAVALVASGMALHASSRRAHGAAVIAIGQPTGSGARLFTPAGSEPLRSGSPLPPGGHLVADAHGGAALRLSTGTEIAIEHGANLAFSDAGPTEHFVLSQGEIRAHVAKLAPGERFIISTPDAEVEVHGTVFRVALAEPDSSCGGGIRTRVAVDEGVVEVRANGQSSFVRRGEHWPAGCAAGPTLVSGGEPGQASAEQRPATGVGSSSPALLRERREARAHSALSTNLEPTTVASRLAEQNDLFSKGVAARRSGDTAGAIAAFDTLLSRYPASALGESAAAERMRALAPANPAAARAAAQRYLARYPQGFARHDADSILAEP